MTELTVRVDLPAGAGAAAAARRAVHGVLPGWCLHDPGWLADAEIVVTELVTNAVRHGGGCLHLDLSNHDGDITLIATDVSPEPPYRRDNDEFGGRGLAIIETIAAAWGVGRHTMGKTVWARLPPCPPPRTSLPVNTGS